MPSGRADGAHPVPGVSRGVAARNGVSYAPPVPAQHQLVLPALPAQRRLRAGRLYFARLRRAAGGMAAAAGGERRGNRLFAAAIRAERRAAVPSRVPLLPSLLPACLFMQTCFRLPACRGVLPHAPHLPSFTPGLAEEQFPFSLKPALSAAIPDAWQRRGFLPAHSCAAVRLKACFVLFCMGRQWNDCNAADHAFPCELMFWRLGNAIFLTAMLLPTWAGTPYACGMCVLQPRSRLRRSILPLHGALEREGFLFVSGQVCCGGAGGTWLRRRRASPLAFHPEA